MAQRKPAASGLEVALLFVLLFAAACSSRDTPAADAAVPDGAVPKSAHAAHNEKRPSLAVSGWAHHALHNFTMNDKQGRTVLKAKKIAGTSDVDALKQGMFHVKNATMEGVEVTLYRDDDGALSLVSAIKKQPPTVRHGMNVPPTDKPKKAPWRMQIGPIDVKDATLTIGFTKKPVVFHIDSAKITVQRRDEDAGPVIYIHEAEGHMMKPKPLPKPVRIAWANGLVNLVGEPLVHLAARTCIRKSELRIDAIVEARKQPVHLLGDSEGIGGALGRMGINIAAHVKKDKMKYQHEAVHIDGGPGCKDAEAPPTPDAPKHAPAKSKSKQ